jgi:hypothetical protein
MENFRYKSGVEATGIEQQILPANTTFFYSWSIS